MKKFLILLVILSLLVSLVGCSLFEGGPGPSEVPEEGSTTNGEVSPPEEKVEVVTPTIISAKELGGGYGILDSSNIDISNFYPGARAEYPIKVVNNNDWDILVEISWKIPNNLRPGFVSGYGFAKEWIVEGLGQYSIPKGTVGEILVAIEIPSDAQDIPEKWEFCLNICDVTQPGTIWSDYDSYWTVEMK